MDMVNSLAVAGEKIKAAATGATEHSFFRSAKAADISPPPAAKAPAAASEMEEAQRAMAQLEKTISEMKRPSGIKVAISLQAEPGIVFSSYIFIPSQDPKHPGKIHFSTTSSRGVNGSRYSPLKEDRTRHASLREDPPQVVPPLRCNRGLSFSSAHTGSVREAKSKLEQKRRTSEAAVVAPLVQGPMRQKSTTPFRNAR